MFHTISIFRCGPKFLNRKDLTPPDCEIKIYDKEFYNPKHEETVMETIENIVRKQKTFFSTGETLPVEFRLAMLRRLREGIEKHTEEIIAALHEDLGKSESESYMTEIGMVYAEIKEALRKTKKWSRPMKVRGTISTFPSNNFIYSEPYGVVLIISPWNYPFNLSMIPLIGAISAGNCAVIKCSRNSARTSRVIQKIINSAFDSEYVCCLDMQSNYDEVLDRAYDYIFFTGSRRVGKIVMAKASENLIPVTLELGGKSPCIIDETANLRSAAKKVAWGKLLNAGQTCIAVDYIAIHRKVKNEFLEFLNREIDLRYPDPLKNETFPNIINEIHYRRLCDLIDSAAASDVIGGQRDDAKLRIAPAVFPNACFDDKIMQDEIFGPLLPITEYEDIDDLTRKINERSKPLACYIFTRDKRRAEKLISDISFGGGCINDVIVQTANHHMPFGGVGHSGMGAYHGKYSFETFSHRKSIVKGNPLIDFPFRYAPFDDKKIKLLRRIYENQ